MGMALTIDFAGETVLVTGGATGLGFAIARAFGEAGARIALNDLSLDRARSACASLAALGMTAVPVAADVRHHAAVETMIAEVIAQLGVPDVVVINAGIYPNAPFLELSEREWDAVIDTNLKGAFLTGQAAARAMVAAGRPGRFVLISSGAALRAYWGWSHYCASKAAVAMLARAMALELGPHGIRANALLPGYVDVEEGGAHLAEAYKAAARTSSPLGRPATPADIANAALLLASPQAGFVSGAVLSVDGGSGAGLFALRPVAGDG
jgi:NAD(P)-dependent dehydrogenase (short-subunit alcohol dehydrogenase family)